MKRPRSPEPEDQAERHEVSVCNPAFVQSSARTTAVENGFTNARVRRKATCTARRPLLAT